MIRFRLGSIPVRIQLTFWVMAVLLGLWSALPAAFLPIWVVIVGVSVLLHELGHAVLARRYGATAEIELHGLGGVTLWSRATPVAPAGRALIAAAGSAVGLAIGGTVLLLARSTGLGQIEEPFVEMTLRSLVWVNFVWGLFNWVPIRQLDGGHILDSLLEIWFPRSHRSISDVVFVSFAVALIAVALWLRLFILAMVALFFGISSFNALQTSRAGRRDSQLVSRLEAARAAFSHGDYETALQEGQMLAPRFQAQSHRLDASGLVVRSLLAMGQAERAATMVDEPPEGFEFYPVDRAQAHLAAGRMKRAIAELSSAVEANPEPEAVGLLLVAYARAGTFHEAARFLSGVSPEALDPGEIASLADTAENAGARDDAQALRLLSAQVSGASGDQPSST